MISLEYLKFFMKDVFGNMVYSYWKGNHRTAHIIRRDDDVIDSESLSIYFRKKLYSTEKTVIPYASGKILDVGCGVGRHTLYFQKKGFDITGIDFAPKAIKVCKERGCKKAKLMDVFHPTLKKQSFDTLLLFGHNIGIGGTLSGAKKLLKSLRQLVKNNGVLLLTSIDVTKTTNAVHLKYHKKNRASGRYIGTVKIRIEYKDQISDWFNWLHIEPKELKKISIASGWLIEHIFYGEHGEYSAVLKPD